MLGVQVWSDLKNNTKKKYARIHRDAVGTGGGPANRLQLTDLEERVLNIVGFQAATGMPEIGEVGLSQVLNLLKFLFIDTLSYS